MFKPYNVAKLKDDWELNKRWQGISCFLIEKERGTLPKGINGSPIPKIGYFGWKTFEHAFDNLFHQRLLRGLRDIQNI